MAKRTIGFEDYQESTFEEYTGEAPPANRWFTGEVVRAKYLEEDDQVRFIIELVDDPDYAGWGKGWYAPFEGAQKWKMQEILRALQGGQTKAVTLDWESEAQVAAWLKKGKRIRFQTELYNDDIKIRKVRPLLEAAGAKTATKAAAPRAEAELPGDVDAGDEAQLEDYTEEELGELEVGELEEILKEEFEVELPTKPRRDPKGEKYADALIDAILEAQSEDADDPAAEDGAADEGDGDGEFSDGFEQDPEPEPEPEPDPEPARPARRTRAATKAAAPPAEPAPAPRTRRARR